mmetsp:Transcript_12663/g.46270  ORF Transcript_12663/g.46270 Transcript_12663/m.46270 type:complete len:210 (+) Transcript_12663:961-1590(+)
MRSPLCWNGSSRGCYCSGDDRLRPVGGTGCSSGGCYGRDARRGRRWVNGCTGCGHVIHRQAVGVDRACGHCHSGATIDGVALAQTRRCSARCRGCCTHCRIHGTLPSPALHVGACNKRHQPQSHAHAGAAHAGDHRGLDVGHFGDSHDSPQSGSRAARVAIRLVLPLVELETVGARCHTLLALGARDAGQLQCAKGRGKRQTAAHEARG